MPKRGDDRPPSIVGETDTDVRAPDSSSLVMPASRRSPYRSIASVPAVDPLGLDVDTVAALLDSHAQVSRTRLRITLPDGRLFFEAYPPEPRDGPELEVPVQLPGHDGTVLRGALPARELQLVAAVIERAVRARSTSGAQLQALDAERKRLSLVFEFSEKVCQLAGFDDVVDRFLGDVCRILDAREGSFFALDPRRKDLFIRCHYGGRPETQRGFRLKVGEGIAGAVAKDGRPRIVNDVDKCPDYVPKSNPIRNIISAPVSVRGKLVGVINVNDRHSGDRPFSNRDLQLLVSLARLGGIALDNARLYEEVRQLLLATIESLTAAIDAKDRFALGHSRRVAFLCALMAKRLKLDDQEEDLLQVAALLHDIGNLAVSETILKKEGPLTPEEQALIKEHPALGASILSPVEQLSAVLPGIVDHHERYDGRGYPRHLKGEEISLQGRVIAVADAFDAMIHDRPFRKACAAPDALGEITANAGTQFDPALVPVFVDVYRELELDRVEIDTLIPTATPGLDF